MRKLKFESGLRMNKKNKKSIYLVLLLFAILPYDYSKLVLGEASIILDIIVYSIRLYLVFYVVYYMKRYPLADECKRVFKYITLYFLFVFVLNLVSSIAFDKTSILELIIRMFSMVYMYGFYVFVIYNYQHFDVINSKIKLVCSVLLFISIILYLFYPDVGRQFEGYGSYVFLGIAGNRNSYYELMVPAIVSVFFLKKDKLKLLDILLIVLIVLTTIATKSLTSIFSLVIFFLLIIAGALFRNKSVVLKVACAIVSAIWLAFFVLLPNSSYINSFSAMFDHKSSTLSGRTMIWEKAIYFIKQNPVLGYGYDNTLIGDTTNYYLQSDNAFPNDTHNSVIFMLLSSGIVGTIVLVYFIVITLKRSIFVVRRDAKYFCISVFIVANLFRGLTESCLHYPHAVFFLYMIMINIRYNQLKMMENKERIEV